MSGLTIISAGSSAEFQIQGNNLVIDDTGDIVLDADGGDVVLKDAGVTFGSLTNNSGNLIIKSGTTTALTFTGANVALGGTISGLPTTYTDVTSLRNNGLVVGGNSQNNFIDFGTDDVILFDIDNTEKMRVDAAGVDVTGAITATGDITGFHSSDKRLKNNITKIENPLDKLDKINGYMFDWIEDKEIHPNKGHDTGVIAQEIEEVIPEITITRDNGYKGIKYDKLVPLLIESIKEQQKQINSLKNEVEFLKKNK